MPLAPPFPLARAVLLAWAALVASGSIALAQGAAPCDTLLVQAEERYVERDFAEAEGFLRTCLDQADPSEEQAIRAFRLLALVFLRQDALTEAREAVVRLLGTSFAYEPDPVQDPPAYVALVGSVKEQLRVEGVAATDSLPALGGPVVETEERSGGGVVRWLLLGGGAVAAGLVAVLLSGGDGGPSGPTGSSPLPPPPSLPR